MICFIQVVLVLEVFAVTIFPMFRSYSGLERAKNWFFNLLHLNK